MPLNGDVMNPQLRLRIGWVIAIVLFCAAGVLFAIDYSRWNSGAGAVYGRATIGSPAPDVAFAALDGSHATIRSFTGHPLLINFFATWCVPCKAELPLIQSRYERLAARGLEVIGLDQQEDAPDVRKFARAHGVTYPVFIDQGAAIDAYGGNSIPMSLFIDAKGVLQAVHIGEMSDAMLDADLQKIL